MENCQPENGPREAGLSLSRILDDDSIEQLEDNRPVCAPAEGWDEETAGKTLEDGCCVECEGRFISPSEFDAPQPIDCPMIQTNQHRCIVNLAPITFVMFALRRNTVKVPGNITRPSRWL